MLQKMGTLHNIWIHGTTFGYAHYQQKVDTLSNKWVHSAKGGYAYLQKMGTHILPTLPYHIKENPKTLGAQGFSAFYQI